MNENYLCQDKSFSVDLKKGEKLLVRVIPEFDNIESALIDNVLIYVLQKDDLGMFSLIFTEDPNYNAPQPKGFGRILFDREGNWIYDGNQLEIVEQEQLAEYIRRSN